MQIKQLLSNTLSITEVEYNKIRHFLYSTVGIQLGANKQSLVTSRLQKRLRHYQLDNFTDYLTLLEEGEDSNELQIFINLLTTNETFFFREIKHFDFLRQTIFPNYKGHHPFRIWSAASSSGEEPYSIAMELAEYFQTRAWELLGSDVSTKMLSKAAKGHYSVERTDGIPTYYLKKYCLKGKGPYQGTLLIDTNLRERVEFRQINLIEPLPDIGRFDVVFLRNILIYFDADKKKVILDKIFNVINPGGYLFIGHTESIKLLNEKFEYIAPAIYRKK